MSPVTKYNAKWVIGIIVGILTISAFAFTMGSGFAQNNADHRAIDTKIGTNSKMMTAKIIESQKVNEKLIGDVQTIRTDIAVLKQQGKQTTETLKEIKSKLK